MSMVKTCKGWNNFLLDFRASLGFLEKAGIKEVLMGSSHIRVSE